jgi:hypothetical protein
VDISSQRIKEERNGCAAPNVANGAMSVKANLKAGLSSPSVTLSTTREISEGGSINKVTSPLIE